MRIAVASSDGVTVNEHFCRAQFFRIYEVNTAASFVETRDAVAACQHSLGHDETRFDKIIELISDCEVILVEKIGEGAAAYLIQKNKRVFEVKGAIDKVIEKLIADKII